VASRSPDIEAWIAEARGADILAIAQALGARLKRVGSEWAGPCPKCGGTDRFSISPAKRVWNCGHQGAAGGDVIELVRHVNAVDFMDAVEFLAGPRSNSLANGHDHAAVEDRRREARDLAREDGRLRGAEDAKARAKRRDAASGLWSDGLPVLGTVADAYLRARGIVLLPEQCEDLRFIKDLGYHGYRDTNDQEGAELGAYPAMIAAVRDVSGGLIGVHRTFLDPARPRKLEPPGDKTRNRAKKILGSVKGGMIRLSPLYPSVAIGEGIETALSWYALGLGPDEIGIATAVSLGNLSGAATAQLPHPKIKGRHVQNGEPDQERPGVALPAGVTDVVILGDGDSDKFATRAHLLTAARRFRSEGRGVTISMAPDGHDWNDVLLEQRAEAAA